jgi:hypothetical protein
MESVSPARLTAAEARALGLPAPRSVPRSTRKAVTGEPYWSRCKTCDEEFTTIAAEDRHLKATKHARFEILKGTS